MVTDLHQTQERLESLTGIRDVPFPQYEHPPSTPESIAADWLSTAEAHGASEPRAMTLSTRDSTGEITSRVVAPTLFDGHTLQIATHSSSRKAEDIASTQDVGGLIYWRELGRQLSVSGSAILAPDNIAEAVWQERAPGYDGVSTVSEQSKPLRSRETLIAGLKELEGGHKLPRPSRFIVFEVDIRRYEFWSATSDRIHRRLVYTRTNEGWAHERLQP